VPTARTSKPSRRDEILTTAAYLFARHGFHGVSMDDLGAALGMSGPAVYHHFPSKDALLADMLITISEELLRGGRQRVDAAADAEAAFDALVAWHVEFALSNPDLILVQARDLTSLTHGPRRRVRQLQRHYVDLWVAALIDIANLDGAAATATAHALFGLINSTPYSSRHDRDRTSALLQAMARHAVAGLAERFSQRQ
jgi:AcrR family transcriptional regulator